MTADLQPRLCGPTLSLRPLVPEDWDALFAAAADPEIWRQHPEPTRYQPAVFRRFFDSGLSSRGAFVILANATGKVIGSSRYYDYDPARREIAVGFTFLTCDHWGGETNRELKQLMLTHAFRFVDTVIFHVGERNLRSRRAVEKLGAKLMDERLTTVGAEGKPVVRLTYRLARVESPWPTASIGV